MIHIFIFLHFKASGSLRDEDEPRDTLNFEERESHEKEKWHPEENAEQVVPSPTEDTIQEDVFVPQQTQNTSNSSKQHPGGSTVVEMMEKGRKKKAGEETNFFILMHF